METQHLPVVSLNNTIDIVSLLSALSTTHSRIPSSSTDLYDLPCGVAQILAEGSEILLTVLRARLLHLSIYH